MTTVYQRYLEQKSCQLQAEQGVLLAEVEALRAQVQRVRELLDSQIYVDAWDECAVPARDLARALDGDA